MRLLISYKTVLQPDVRTTCGPRLASSRHCTGAGWSPRRATGRHTVSGTRRPTAWKGTCRLDPTRRPGRTAGYRSTCRVPLRFASAAGNCPRCLGPAPMTTVRGRAARTSLDSSGSRRSDDGSTPASSSEGMCSRHIQGFPAGGARLGRKVHVVLRPPSRMVTFHFADIEGCMRRWEERPEEARVRAAGRWISSE